MARLTVAEFAKVVQGQVWGKQTEQRITSIVTDSRNVREGSLFIAIRGENFDGHLFMKQALEAGAAAVLSEEAPTDPEWSVIQVEQCIEAMAELGRFCLKQNPVKVVAITGSVGKTSCKELVASVLSEKYHVLKTEGNLNTETGLPITLYNLEQEHQVVVLEMGMQGLGEIAHLTKIAPPDYAAVTNILGVHLERLGSLQAIAQAKAEIFLGMKLQGLAFFREDEPWKDYLIQQIQGPYYTYGFSLEGDFYASDLVSKGLEGSEFILNGPNQIRMSAKIPLPGKHMVENACLAAAIGHFLGLNAEEIVTGLTKTQPMKQRSSLLRLSGDRVVINDCYNSSPTSLRASLEVVNDLREDRFTMAVLADMKELGVTEVEEHQLVGSLLAKSQYQALITKGHLSTELGNVFCQSSEKAVVYWHCETNKEIADHLFEILPEHSILLIKGSRSMALDDLAGRLLQHWEDKHE
jgi:UDP-N-acetylmuramoyl-tripeptide--D-alanyl-D-alanine ligase